MNVILLSLSTLTYHTGKHSHLMAGENRKAEGRTRGRFLRYLNCSILRCITVYKHWFCMGWAMSSSANTRRSWKWIGAMGYGTFA
jgi:hypothetical protein